MVKWKYRRSVILKTIASPILLSPRRRARVRAVFLNCTQAKQMASSTIIYPLKSLTGSNCRQHPARTRFDALTDSQATRNLITSLRYRRMHKLQKHARPTVILTTDWPVCTKRWRKSTAITRASLPPSPRPCASTCRWWSRMSAAPLPANSSRDRATAMQ